MFRLLKRWREKRAAEQARIAACDEAQKQSDDLVDALMAGRAPVADRVTFPEWCELVGTTTDEMAGAQEIHEAEERGY